MMSSVFTMSLKGLWEIDIGYPVGADLTFVVSDTF